MLMDVHSLTVFPWIERALQYRLPQVQQLNNGALRLFNGFTEGFPDLVIDLYADTLVIFDYGAKEIPQERQRLLVEWFHQRIPAIHAILLKSRNSAKSANRRGVVIDGGEPAQKILENGVWYSLNLTMNQDASLYLDTRLLREWLGAQAAGKAVLNTFAYTGSLGIAAAAGGARKVTQSDLNPRFLDLARQSAALNQIPEKQHRLQAGDFFSQVAGFKRGGTLFDIVIADPPFFSATDKGRVDLVGQSRRVINKLRPLVQDGGWLVSINNALFVSGADYMADLTDLSKDGYLSVEDIIPVPDDFIGYPETRHESWPTDPAPFNHPTKIAILRVHRKQS